MKFIFYIDGDNAPKQSVNGILELGVMDTVHIFYAHNNQHYCKKENRAEIDSKCGCLVYFHPVLAGENAVDFAIAMHAANTWSDGPTSEFMTFLISHDSHFDIIRRQLAETYGLAGSVQVGKSIQEIWDRYFWLKVKDEEEFKFMLEDTVGEHNVSFVINRLRSMFAPVSESLEEVQFDEAKEFVDKFEFLVDKNEKPHILLGGLHRKSAN